jgi:hypothetical protein
MKIGSTQIYKRFTSLSQSLFIKRTDCRKKEFSLLYILLNFEGSVNENYGNFN